MKRILATLFLAAAAMLGIQSTASAAPIQTITRGGVTCSQWAAKPTWPTTYWACVNPANPSNAEFAIVNGAFNISATPKTTLSANGVQIYAFNTPADYAAFTGAANPGPGAMGAALTAANLTGAPVAAAFFSNTINGVNTNISNYTAFGVASSAGQMYGQYSGKVNDPVFVALQAYDELWLNGLGNNFWPAAYYNSFPGKTNYEIFGSVFGNTTKLFFGYAFAQQNGSPSAIFPLGTAITPANLPGSNGWIKNYVVQASPTNPATLGTNANNHTVVCVKYFLTGNAKFPFTWSDCANPYNPQNAEASVWIAANGFPSALKDLLGDNVNHINWADLYVFETKDDYSLFFNRGALGLNILGVSSMVAHPAISDSSVFLNTDNGVNHKLNVSAYSGNTSTHELGHQLDFVWGRPSHTNQNWLTAIANDKTAFNAKTCPDAIDQWVPAGGTKYCAANPNLDNWTIYTTKILSLANNTLNEELWANVFAQKQGPASTIPLIYQITLQMINQRNYMGTVIANGQP